MHCDRTTRIKRATILQAYERRAVHYSKLAVVQCCLTKWLADWLDDGKTAAAQTAIEFGAGDGLFTRFVAARYANLIATDISPRMVEQGRRRLPRVNWQVADAWNYVGAPADRLFSASLLQWCPEPARVLRQWRRVTNKGGRMLHGFYVAPTLPEWYSLESLDCPLQWHSPQEWENLFRAAGWLILRSETRLHKQEFHSGLDFIRFLQHTGGPGGRSLTTAQLRRQIAAYERGFPAQVLAGGVISTWTMFRIEVTC